MKILQQLVDAGQITEQQANLAQQVPMADDTVEADSEATQTTGPRRAHPDHARLTRRVPGKISAIRIRSASAQPAVSAIPLLS